MQRSVEERQEFGDEVYSGGVNAREYVGAEVLGKEERALMGIGEDALRRMEREEGFAQD